VSQGAATYDGAYFRDTDPGAGGGGQTSMTMTNICTFLGGTKFAGAANEQSKDSFRRTIPVGGKAYSFKETPSAPVTKNGVTFKLKTYPASESATARSEPMWKAYSATTPFPCTCGLAPPSPPPPPSPAFAPYFHTTTEGAPCPAGSTQVVNLQECSGAASTYLRSTNVAKGWHSTGTWGSYLPYCFETSGYWNGNQGNGDIYFSLNYDSSGQSGYRICKPA